MHSYPHLYAVSADAGLEGDVRLTSNGLAEISSAPPAEFGGPGDQWSPETLLVAAVADCFVLTFRAIARASKLEWVALKCEVEGVLDRTDKVVRFTEFKLKVLLHVPQGTNEQQAKRILEKSENGCLITNSLKSDTQLEAEVRAG
ncbi:OsmC family protein [Woeseia oceani]|uniref:Osmotically inducible protein OsmC n=1 Tax=Woeseia oceani TaxID=1548547 RepID=A0A193LKP0_9GAMM|nr:OsmC family protein [Woeseia oceani]ANO52969.1 osmotically inducible protein OsmC [Woeseia oceani]